MALSGNPPCMKRWQTLGGIFSLIVETGLRGLGKVLNYGCCCMKSLSCGNLCICVRSCTLMYMCTRGIVSVNILHVKYRCTCMCCLSSSWSGAKQYLNFYRKLQFVKCSGLALILVVSIVSQEFFSSHTLMKLKLPMFEICWENWERTKIRKPVEVLILRQRARLKWVRWHLNPRKDDLQASIQFPDCNTF